MRRKLLFFLAAEAVVLLIMDIFSDLMPALFSSAAAFPFEQLGAGLRALSLTGRVGNGAALALWLLIGLAPAAYAVYSGREVGRRWENAALCVMTPAILLTLYCMVNPAFAASSTTIGFADALPVIRAMLGGAVWALIVCYIVLRTLRLFRRGDMDTLVKYMRRMLCVLCALFVWEIAFSGVTAMIAELRAAQLAADSALAVIRFLISSLPYAMDIAVTFSALKLLEAMSGGAGEAAAKAAAALSKLCCIALALIVSSTVALNYLQLLLMGSLSNVNTTVSIPIMSLAFVLAALLLSRLIEENGRLKDENESFI